MESDIFFVNENVFEIFFNVFVVICFVILKNFVIVFCLLCGFFCKNNLEVRCIRMCSINKIG